MFSRLALIGILFATNLCAAPVKEIKTINEYQKYFNDEKPLIILYSGEHCPPCKQLKPLYTTAATAHNDIRFCAIDADTNNKSLLDHMELLTITGIPTLICSCKGKIILRCTGGLSKKGLEQKIEKFSKKLKKAKTKQVQKPKPSTESKKTTTKKLKAS